MGFFIPETIKKMNNWLVWKKVLVNGAWKKHPYNLVDRKMGGHTNPAKWVNYDLAVKALKYGDFDGIGFGLLESDRLTFIDIDKCIDEDGVLSDLAEEVLELFPDTYTELSQSETGLHIICRGTVPAGFNNQAKGIEMYSGGRYIAITGNAWTLEEPAECQEAINSLYSKYNTNNTEQNHIPKPQNAPSRVENASVIEIIETIKKSRQGEKFERLHAGMWENWIYKSQSEAEMAYFAIVNYFTGGNDELTAAVFASSKLAERKKGQRADYIQRTINKAKATATTSNKLKDNYRELMQSTAKDAPKNHRKRF